MGLFWGAIGAEYLEYSGLLWNSQAWWLTSNSWCQEPNYIVLAVLWVCAHCSCLSNAANTELGIICWHVGTSMTLPAGKAQIKEIISHLRVIYLVEQSQTEFSLYILLPSMGGTGECVGLVITFLPPTRIHTASESSCLHVHWRNI